MSTNQSASLHDTFVFEPRELGKVSLLEYVFSQFAELARARGIELIVAFHAHGV